MELKILLDSNIIIEFFKGNKEALKILEDLIDHNEKLKLYLSIFSVEEIFYILKKRKKLKIDKILKFFEMFNIKHTNKKILTIFFKYVQKYNIDTIDLMILATCKYYKINHLISLDTDFKIPCEKEGIILIDCVDKLEKFSKEIDCK